MNQPVVDIGLPIDPEDQEVFESEGFKLYARADTVSRIGDKTLLISARGLFQKRIYVKDIL